MGARSRSLAHLSRRYVRPAFHGLLVAAAAIAAACLVVAPAMAEPSPQPTRASGADQRYYVVGQPMDGQREYLYDIAVKTVGDGNRYREIFELNRGRPQADGGRLTDITELHPGWVLVLPPDAKGPMVHVGAVPTDRADAATAARAPSTGRDGGALLWTGIGTLLFAAAGLALVRVAVLRRVTSRSASPSKVTGRAALPAGLAARPAPRQGEQESDVVEPDPGTPNPGGMSVADDGDLQGRLTSNGYRWEVKLVGSGAATRTPSYKLLAGSEGPPDGIMPVVLGSMDGLRLCVDLGHAPSTFTIVGPLPVCRRQARLIVEQVLVMGLSVLVVGEAFGGEHPAGCEPVAAFPQDPESVPPGIVIGTGLNGANLRAVRSLPARSDGRVVPVIIGNVLRSGWSLRLIEETSGGA